jgi:PPOX class probable F420-dependent enzyme
MSISAVWESYAEVLERLWFGGCDAYVDRGCAQGPLATSGSRMGRLAVMDDHLARRRFAAARVAHLGTVRPDGTPHLVPVTFAVDDDVIYTAVDAKPKRTRCTLLVDHYDDDWSRLWWVRADGDAAVFDSPDSSHPAFALLAARYAAYAVASPHGPLIVISVSRWVGWSAA